MDLFAKQLLVCILKRWNSSSTDITSLENILLYLSLNFPFKNNWDFFSYEPPNLIWTQKTLYYIINLSSGQIYWALEGWKGSQHFSSTSILSFIGFTTLFLPDHRYIDIFLWNNPKYKNPTKFQQIKNKKVISKRVWSGYILVLNISVLGGSKFYLIFIEFISIH